jgi:type I restriction enzyme S subunit
MRCELPQGWEEVRLKEVSDYINDKVPIDNCQMETYISTTNMIENKGGIAIADSIPKAKTINSFKQCDILISNIRPYFKKIWFAAFNGTNSADVLIIRGNKNIQSKYLYYVLSNDYFFEYATKSAKGTKMPRGDKTAIMNYLIPKLSFQEQKAIADTLSALDNKIELNKKINANLEAQARAIFKHWFVDFEFPNENGNPYKSSGGEMVDSELGMIPKGWGVRKLGDKINISNGKRPNVKNEVESAECPYPILGASGIMGYTNNFLYVEPILVIGRVGTHGVVQKVDSRVWTSDNTMVIKSNYYEFVNIILENLDYKSLNRGSTQPLLTQIDIKNQKIVFPDELRTQTFETITGCFRKLIKSNQQQNQRLSQLRDTLLPKLMSGKIRIPLD